MELKLVSTFREVEDNAERFSYEEDYLGSAAYSRLAQFSHWYYFPNIDVFAPSKFIGYKNSSLSSYNGLGTGTDTQLALEKWFHKLDRKSTQFSLLKNKLESFLLDHDKSISKKTLGGTGGIYVPLSQLSIVDFPDQITDENYFEGAAKTVIVNAYERNPKARRSCIDHWGLSCYVCSMDFEAAYGELGRGFIHVHHIRELSMIGSQYKVDPIKDLRPLCPNCHAMVHKKKPAIDPDDLKALCNKVI